MTGRFRLTTNLHVPDANEAYEAVVRAKEQSRHEFNWLMNDIVIAIDAQANSGTTYLYYEFQQWRSEAAYYTTCRTASPTELLKRWQEIVDIFYNIIDVLKDRNYQVFFQDNHPLWIVIAWDVNNRVGDLVRRRTTEPNSNPTSDFYHPQYELPAKEPELVPDPGDGIARRLMNMVDPKSDPLSDQYQPKFS